MAVIVNGHYFHAHQTLSDYSEDDGNECYGKVKTLLFSITPSCYRAIHL